MNRITMSQSMTRLLGRLDRGLERFERAVLTGGVLAMAAVSITNVAARNLLGTGFTFAEEINQIIMVLITFLGLGYGIRHARHIRMSAVYDQLGGRVRKGLLVITHLGTGLLLLLLAWYAVEYVAGVQRVGSVTPAMRVPLYLVYACVPLGLALGGIQYLLATWRNLTTPGVYLSFQQREAYSPTGEEQG